MDQANDCASKEVEELMISVMIKPQRQPSAAVSQSKMLIIRNTKRN
jgi:hypothetical protein